MNELTDDSINSRIYTLRGVQVLLDRDLAELYAIETRSLKQAVNRNLKRFPSDFMFILNEKEVEVMVSQNVIPSKKHLGGSLPYAFTEQGVANLSSILTSERAIDVNIQIMRAFVTMRRFITSNAQIFYRLDSLEHKHLEYDKNFDKIFDSLQGTIPEKGIFFDGRIFDAYKFVSDLIRSASTSLVLIDNYVDESVLLLLDKRKLRVHVTLFTKMTKQLSLDLAKYHAQYPLIEVKEFTLSHDRFLIIDNNEAFTLIEKLRL